MAGSFFFFFNDTATTEIYTLSLHDALPICEFSNHILSASSGIPKTYWVKVTGPPAAEELQALRDGISLDGRKTLPARIRALPPQGRRDSGHPWHERGV